MFSWLFGEKKKLLETATRDVWELVKDYTVPDAHLVRSGVASRSHLDGKPTVMADFAWPSKNGSAPGFMAQIDLSEFQHVLDLPWLANAGTPLFLYDHVTQDAWGFAPKDRDRNYANLSSNTAKY